MKNIKGVLIELLKTMIQDLKRRSFDESGEQRAETEGRVDSLQELLAYLRE